MSRPSLSLVSWALGLALAAAPPALGEAPTWKDCEQVGEVGAYVFRLCPEDADGVMTALVVEREGTEVFRTVDHRIDVEPPLIDGPGGGQPVTLGFDVTGDGLPNAMVLTDSGGAHCCVQLFVLTLGPEFVLANRIDAGNYSPRLLGLDREPGLELEVRDNIFAYWKAPFATSPAPRVILKFSDGRYRPAPELMRDPPLSDGRLQRHARAVRRSPRWDESATYPLDSALWAVMLELVYSGNHRQAEEFLGMAWPQGRAGRDGFGRAFFECQLRLSFYWPAVAALNDLPADPPAGHCGSAG